MWSFRLSQALSYAAAVIFASAVLTSSTLAQTEKPIYSFQGGSDGSDLVIGVVSDSAGNLYGAINNGGTHNNGTVFELAPPAAGGLWTKTVLFNFPINLDYLGINSLVIDPAGNLYGTTLYGGKYRYGMVFQLARPSQPGGLWTFAELHDFSNGLVDGAGPIGLVVGQDGSLYGFTDEGGTYDSGTVFQLQPPAEGKVWKESVLYSFSSLGSPIGNPAFDNRGNLYGALFSGGITNCNLEQCGSIFELAPPSSQGGAWTESLVYEFTGGGDGGQPQGSLTVDPSGSLYGVTFYGANIFKLSPGIHGGWIYSLLYTLPTQDYWRPNGALLLDGGSLFGTTFYGGNFGCGNGCGSVYKLSPPAQSGDPWTETDLHFFQVTGDGHNPFAGVIVGKDGLLYGTTESGGLGDCSTSQSRGCGTVYSVIP
jgi:uncharacterized repeat protein (TIGR03803 family)